MLKGELYNVTYGRVQHIADHIRDLSSYLMAGRSRPHGLSDETHVGVLHKYNKAWNTRTMSIIINIVMLNNHCRTQVVGNNYA